MGKDYVTKSDLKKLNDPDRIPQRFRIIYNTLFYSGMRPGEVLKTKPQELKKEYREDKDRNYYFIDLKTQKNKQTNELTPIREVEYISIIDYIKMNEIKNKCFVFGSSKYKFEIQMSVSWLGRKLNDHLKLVGIDKDITPQSFRAGLVTYLKEKGISYAEIATITRHQNLTVMQKHYDKRQKHNAYNIIENM